MRNLEFWRNYKFGGMKVAGKYESNYHYIYGTTAPKINTDFHEILSEDEHKYSDKRKREERAKKVRGHKLRVAGNVFLIFLGCLFLMVQYASITFNQNEIYNMKTELKEIQNTNVSLKSEIAESIDLTTIRQKAMENLGMVEPAPHQIVYIDIPKVSYTAYYQPKSESKEQSEESFVAASFFDFLKWKE